MELKTEIESGATESQLQVTCVQRDVERWMWGEGEMVLFELSNGAKYRVCIQAVSYTHLTLPTNREV